MRSSLTEDRAAVSAVALAIAEVIAKRVVADDVKLSRLDGLGKIMATQDIARGMVGSLANEALAAIQAVEAYREAADERAA